MTLLFSWQRQLERVKELNSKITPLKSLLNQIASVDKQCQEANIDDNDYTVCTMDDLSFELDLVQQAVAKKLAFIENQIVSRNMTNLTPAQLEEFESTFRFFDKEHSNSLGKEEFNAALASLGIFYEARHDFLLPSDYSGRMISQLESDEVSQI